MAFTDESGNGMVMPVSPMYGGNGNGMGFGGDWAWIILLLLLGWGNNGWGGNGFDGGAGALYPWMNQTETINDGFRDQMLNTGIASIQNSINDVGRQISTDTATINASVNSGFAQAEISANARQMADMNQRFALQSQLADCCCENRLATCQTQNIVQNEGNMTRFADANNTRDIIDSQTRGTQAILDKLCALELDSVKQDNANLRTQLNMASLAASQNAQTASIRNEIINELRSCPIPSQPVYGNTPIFTCGSNNSCGCGCGNGSF
jgi:hypothetical protein